MAKGTITSLKFTFYRQENNGQGLIEGQKALAPRYAVFMAGFQPFEVGAATAEEKRDVRGELTWPWLMGGRVASWITPGSATDQLCDHSQTWPLQSLRFCVCDRRQQRFTLSSSCTLKKIMG